MAVPLILQFSIALFSGMVLSTFIAPVRRLLTRPVEIGLWIGLVTVCFLGITSVADPRARELDSSAMWAAGQMVNLALGGIAGGAAAWVAGERFVLAVAVVILIGADVLALTVIRSIRIAEHRRPRVRLREWIEVPLPNTRPLVARPWTVAVVSRKVAAGLTWGAALMLSATLALAIWARNVVLPREARRIARAAGAGRAGSKAGLESLHDAAGQLQFAAQAWYSGAGAPLLGGLGSRAVGALRGVRRVAEPAIVISAGQVVDISALLGAGSIGWYGPLSSTSDHEAEGEQDVAPQRPDRLAS